MEGVTAAMSSARGCWPSRWWPSRMTCAFVEHDQVAAVAVPVGKHGDVEESANAATPRMLWRIRAALEICILAL